MKDVMSVSGQKLTRAGMFNFGWEGTMISPQKKKKKNNYITKIYNNISNFRVNSVNFCQFEKHNIQMRHLDKMLIR